MKNKNLVIVAFVLMVAAASVVFWRAGGEPGKTQTSTSVPDKQSHSHAAATTAHAVTPAFQTAAEARSLSPTLPASQFVGKVREAYQVAKEIPQTLAQLPCYCHCDESFGHKSLQTCFVDDHASHCAVCVDEALLAYRLQKEGNLTPDQIRTMIVEKYSAHAE